MDLKTIAQIHACDINPEGTEVSGYVEAKDGPFRCDHCAHYAKKDSCNHPVVMADPKLKKNNHGDAIVEDGACCNYFRKKVR